jgi:lipoyl(octanoyl) transferase
MMVRWYGRLAYNAGLRLQDSLLEIQRSTGLEFLALLEHEPVYTIGRNPDQSSLRVAALLPHPVHVINRGGHATYHGPGQLVAYPIIDLIRRGRDLHAYLRALESAIIQIASHFGVSAGRVEGKTGVWVGDRKLASIGVGVRKWVTMHGLALNVDSDLHGFQSITPCGLTGVQMTSLSLEAGQAIPLASVWQRAAIIIPEVLDATRWHENGERSEERGASSK